MSLWLKYRQAVFGFLLCCSQYTAKGQQQVVPLQKEYQLNFERAILQNEGFLHTGFLPLLQNQTAGADRFISSLQFDDSSESSWLIKKALFEHLFQYDSNGVQFSIDPLVNIELSQNKAPKARPLSLFKNMRGFVVRLNLGSKFSAESSFRENQSNLPNYLNDRTALNRVAYGQGRVKQFNEDGFDFAMASSVISYSPSKSINLQAGHGKHFIGYGQRSLLLSDLAFNYPFFKLSTTWFKGRLNYQNMYALFQDIRTIDTDSESEGLLERKQGSFHYLDFAVHPKLNIGLLEGMIYKSIDSTGNVAVPGTFYLPLIFLNSFLNGNSQKGNNSIGLNWTYKAFKTLQIYGQAASLGFESSDYSFQLGSNYYADFLPIRFALEFNHLAENDKGNLFNHYNESLTSPAPAGSNEVLASMLFQKKRWLTRLAANQIEHKTQVLHFAEFMQAYVINPKTNLALRFGLQYRLEKDSNTELNLFYFGLSTNLQNLYFNY